MRQELSKVQSQYPTRLTTESIMIHSCKTGFWLLILFACISLICGFKRIVPDTESTREITLKVHYDTARVKRSTENVFPENLDVQIPVVFNHVTLSLRKNGRITHHMPVTVERNGKIIYHKLPKTQDVGYYFDTESDSAFMVQYGDNNDDFKNDFAFFGSFSSGGKRFLVQAPDSDHRTHTLTDISPEKKGSADDAIFPENELHSNHFPKQNYEAPKLRRRRDTEAIKYEIELLMVFDYSAYSKFLKRAKGSTFMERDTNAKSDLTKYSALLLGAIDLRFRTITGQGYEIHLIPAGLHIADTEETSWWTEMSKIGAGVVDRFDVRHYFAIWVNWTRESIPGNDHAMLFTGYGVPQNSWLWGVSLIGKLCDNEDKVSVVRDILAGDTATIAAHELGHNLGAYHDGDTNTCDPYGRYVMTPSPKSELDAPKNLRLWGFSNCSLNYFNSFISELNKNNTNCMTKRSATYDATRFDKYSNELLGQIYPPDVQCKSIYGPKSVLCREFAYSGICSRMFCEYPSNGRCLTKIALEGTTCGNRKICKKGHCVTSDKAPVIDSEYCMFGEQPSYNLVFTTSKTCQEWLKSKDNHYRCYYYHYQCCETCARVAQSYSHLKGCTYGDKANCSKISGNGCYQYSQDCCSTCSKYETGIKGCEYGDRLSDCNPSLCHLYDLRKRTTLCCSSCAKLRKKRIN